MVTEQSAMEAKCADGLLGFFGESQALLQSLEPAMLLHLLLEPAMLMVQLATEYQE